MAARHFIGGRSLTGVFPLINPLAQAFLGAPVWLAFGDWNARHLGLLRDPITKPRLYCGKNKKYGWGVT